ncbi:hypothetical protein [Streptomyces sp. 11x1]|uniref:hypothetical protein n=1 Tax=Streptomyces sp. 11x1 TaxID=3038642 RepID=UPI0029303467|nr:hypothetical protein [Streptomyces sp. 11x1]WNZ06438.1 hypothetical protein P8T65_01735 [Streptomyces sp. 11x1]
MREQAPSGDVTDALDPWCGPHLPVHGQIAGLGVEPDALQAEPGQVRPASGGHQQVLPGDLLSALQGEPEGVVRVVDAGGASCGAYGEGAIESNLAMASRPGAH